jgi:collagenase-like PrtC family protease
MPSYAHVKPTPLPILSPSQMADSGDAPEETPSGLRQTGSMKRGGVGACVRICQQPWDLYASGKRVDTRMFPSRQISRVAEIEAYAEAGVDVLKLQGRSLPVELLAQLVRRYREAIDAGAVPAADRVVSAALPAAWAVIGR